MRRRDLVIGFVAGAAAGAILVFVLNWLPIYDFLLRYPYVALVAVVAGFVLDSRHIGGRMAGLIAAIGAAWLGFLVGVYGLIVVLYFAMGPLGP